MALTLKDLARLANVAESTVSRAINNKPGVSEEKRKEILNLADKYNYKPNRLAKGLAEKRTKIIALLLPDLENTLSLKVISAVEEELEEQGYQMLICNTKKDISKTENYLKMLLEDQIDGVIILGGTPTTGKMIQIGLDKGERIVLVDKLLEEVVLTSHLIDHNKSGTIAAERLFKNSNKIKPVILIGEENDYIEQERLRGFVDVCKKHGHKPEILTGINTRQDGYESFFQLVNNIDIPTGIFFTSNIAGIGLIESVKTGGWLIPDDFEVIGCEDDIISRISNPKLTVIKNPLIRMAQNAAKSLIDSIRSKTVTGEVRIYEPELVENDSTK
ncbi:LacI family DNA-binding transcriptional regulator [Halanaerobiaceae bacterium Z-7014]|uniref:LacI family DNA-binding transcriptional regulator n=1 Tax=Halonatronomonas betaini TaxID=2778430 RepID=A0A931F8V4_9FIRM|nr:LacI family DNA-binding transcriptional regulator [Halonatronomonas betaini]